MRGIDILVSLLGLIVLSPLLLLVAILVKCASPGPVFFRARRVGRGGRIFTMYKFRSMRVADEIGPRITASEQDPRITPLGAVLRKYKIDELPQLINVLRGEMALVGPRPEDPDFIRYYTPAEMGVLSVRPGLTGPVQLIYRELAEQHLRPDEDPTQFYLNHVLHTRLAADLHYIRHRSLTGDLRLIGQTILHVLGVQRISQEYLNILAERNKRAA
jgi:lipopolysaccharide/colanic/teichoic acid biosynthesis glycosyltransferase